MDSSRVNTPRQREPDDPRVTAAGKIRVLAACLEEIVAPSAEGDSWRPRSKQGKREG